MAIATVERVHPKAEDAAFRYIYEAYMMAMIHKPDTFL